MKLLISLVAVLLCSSCAHVYTEDRSTDHIRAIGIGINSEHFKDAKIKKAQKIVKEFCGAHRPRMVSGDEWNEDKEPIQFVTNRGVNISIPRHYEGAYAVFACETPDIKDLLDEMEMEMEMKIRKDRS